MQTVLWWENEQLYVGIKKDHNQEARMFKVFIVLLPWWRNLGQRWVIEISDLSHQGDLVYVVTPTPYFFAWLSIPSIAF